MSRAGLGGDCHGSGLRDAQPLAVQGAGPAAGLSLNVAELAGVGPIALAGDSQLAGKLLGGPPRFVALRLERRDPAAQVGKLPAQGFPGVVARADGGEGGRDVSAGPVAGLAMPDDRLALVRAWMPNQARVSVSSSAASVWYWRAR